MDISANVLNVYTKACSNEEKHRKAYFSRILSTMNREVNSTCLGPLCPLWSQFDVITVRYR